MGKTSCFLMVRIAVVPASTEEKRSLDMLILIRSDESEQFTCKIVSASILSISDTFYPS